MGYLGRRIGKSQDQGNSSPTGSDAGGGILDLFAAGYFNRQGTLSPDLTQTGLTATGGVISDYTSGSDVYRAHVFASSGKFTVTSLGNLPAEVDYLVVGAGGGGGDCGGGGAGGYRSSMPEGPGGPSPSAESKITVTTSPGEYTVTVGAGGRGDANDGARRSTNGNPSVFGPITAQGGGKGGGGHANDATSNGQNGGSGGGASTYYPGGPQRVGGTGNRETGTTNPAPNQGYDGGDGQPGWWTGGGGGGAGAAGADTASDPTGAAGGVGKRTTILGPAYSVGTPGPGSTTGGWLAGGGGGAGPTTGGAAGDGGGGAGANNGPLGGAGQPNTGGGGGGVWENSAGSGGSGLVVVKYKIGTTETQTAKATGGNISFYGGKTIHTFTSTGAFSVTDASLTSIDLVLVAGGGAGG